MERESHQPQLDLTIRHRQNGKLSDRVATSTVKCRELWWFLLTPADTLTYASPTLILPTKMYVEHDAVCLAAG